MKMKKITAMALACVMALGLAACGGTSSSTGTSADSAAPASSTGTAAEPCDLVVAWVGQPGDAMKNSRALWTFTRSRTPASPSKARQTASATI